MRALTRNLQARPGYIHVAGCVTVGQRHEFQHGHAGELALHDWAAGSTTLRSLSCCKVSWASKQPQPGNTLCGPRALALRRYQPSTQNRPLGCSSLQIYFRSPQRRRCPVGPSVLSAGRLADSTDGLGDSRRAARPILHGRAPPAHAHEQEVDNKNRRVVPLHWLCPVPEAVPPTGMLRSEAHNDWRGLFMLRPTFSPAVACACGYGRD